MKIMKYFLIALCYVISACSKTETESTTIAAQKIEATFLVGNEIPVIEILPDTDVLSTLKLRNRKGMIVVSKLDTGPGETPSVRENFYSVICGKETLVLVLRQGVNTGVSEGKYYFNVLINPADGKVITTFEAGEVLDKETKEIISDDQKAVIAKLKAGVDRNCPAILQPDDDGTASKLLIGH